MNKPSEERDILDYNALQQEQKVGNGKSERCPPDNSPIFSPISSAREGSIDWQHYIRIRIHLHSVLHFHWQRRWFPIRAGHRLHCKSMPWTLPPTKRQQGEGIQIVIIIGIMLAKVLAGYGRARRHAAKQHWACQDVEKRVVGQQLSW